MVYAVGLAEAQPRIDSSADCGHCGDPIVWDEIHGWLHLDGFYACRHPVTGLPREVMASPSATQKTREAVAQYRAWLVKQQGGVT